MPVSATPSRLDFTGNDEFDLVAMLLQEQQQLTAVEKFSRVHDQHAGNTSVVSVPAQAKYYQTLLPATPPSEVQQFAFEVNLDTCSGCKACVVACHTLNGLEEDESWRKVGTVAIGSVGTRHVTTACHHCEDPGCLNGCPVKAYDKDPVTGIVQHLDDQCIGCKYCTMMCPYEVPKYSKRLGIVRKCDMCHNRLAAGEAPACVQSCPNEAIRIRLVDRKSVVNESQSLAPGAPASSITRPTTHYISDRLKDFEAGMPHDDRIDEVAESHWPLAALLLATQISVGMLICERVAAAVLWISGSEMPVTFTAFVATLSLVNGGVGLNLAPLHLGQPLRAWRVFLGLRTSWLSREAVVLGKYVGALAAATLLLWLPSLDGYLPESVSTMIADYLPSWAAKLTLGICLPIGLAGLYSSAMIYIATKRSLWRHGRTLPRFGGTTLIGGIAFTVSAIAAAAAYQGLDQSGLSAVLAIAISVAVIASIAKLTWEWKTQLGPSEATDHPLDRRSRKLIGRELSGLRSARMLAGISSTIILFLAGFTVAVFGAAHGTSVAICSFAALVVLASESFERLIYFMSVVYERMPGTMR